MNKIDRIKAAISGEKPDVLPYSLWTHLPEIDLDPKLLAEKTYEFYKRYDVDFIKTMNNGMYAVENFGCEVDYSEIKKGGVAHITKTMVHKKEDWAQIEPVGLNGGAISRELLSLKLTLEKTKGEVPVIFTVFSPITTANKICCNKLLEHISDGGSELVHNALRAITQTTCRLAEKAIEMGADGVFFASQMSNYNVMPEDIYLEYGKKYDLQVLEAASKGWFNTLHAHGSDIMFDLLKDYPVQVFNWHAWESLPNLLEAQEITGKCLLGGIQRMDITNCRKNELQSQIYNCIKQLGGRKHILSPGCVIRYPLDEKTLDFVRKVKLEIEEKVLRK